MRACSRRQALLAALALPQAARAQQARAGRPDVPYVPTPPQVVRRMCELAKVGRRDVVYDLGCGDGRLVIEAARRGARGVGIDIDPELVERARTEARNAGVGDRVEFRVADLFKSDYSDGSVVMLYLLPQLNLLLRPQLWRQLKVGSRIVSHSFDMGDWEPARTERVSTSTVYLWTVTAAQKKAV